MSSCMDFIGNQWLVQQYRDADEGIAKSRILYDLVEGLQLEGLSLEEAVGEVKGILGEDTYAETALSRVRERKRFTLG